MNTKAPFHFVDALNEVLTEQLQIPMWGYPPPFPWEAASEAISKTLGAATLNMGDADWKEGTLLSGLGQDVQTIAVELAPLSAPLFLACPASDVKKLTRLLMKEDGPGLDDPDIAKAFFQFSFINLLADLSDIRPLGDLNPQLADHPFECHKAYAIDLAIEGEQTCWVRILCPEPFYAQFQSHFAQNKPSLIDHPKASDIDIPLSIEVGSTQLSASKWSEVELGDFVILDHCSYQINATKGSMLLTSASKPLFQLRSKEGEIKILDFAYIFEETPMEETPEEAPPEEETPTSEDMSEESPPPTHTEHQDLISADNVPLQITVEVGRLRMPLSKVLALQPGNVLDLKMRPEEGVTLSISGKPVAKGELIQVGDVLGVKITDKG